MTRNERLRDLLSHLKDRRVVHNQAEFAVLSGYSKGYISQLISADRPVSEQNVYQICKNIPIINLSWLLAGEGVMFNDREGSAVAEEPRDKTVDDLLSEKDERIKDLKSNIASQQSVIANQQAIIEQLKEVIDLLKDQ